MKKSVPVFTPEPEKEPELPAHLMAEKFILGAILIDNAAMEGLELLPEHFSLESNQRIYQAMLTLADFNSGIDRATLSHELARTKQLVDVGVPYLTDLTLGMPSRPHVKDYVRIVKEKYRLRQLIMACQKASDRAWDQSEDAADIIFTLEKEIGSL